MTNATTLRFLSHPLQLCQGLLFAPLFLSPSKIAGVNARSSVGFGGPLHWNSDTCRDADILEVALEAAIHHHHYA
jgi:hypothetical protein